MGRLRLLHGAATLEIAASRSTRVGRHWSSDVRIVDAAIPLHWLEIRWRGDRWCWRTLAAAERTRGSGASEDGPWRGWSAGGGRVRLDGTSRSVELLLVDAAPPEVLIERLDDPRRFAEPEIDEFVQHDGDGRFWPLGAEPDEDEPLADGEVFVFRDRAYRLHLPEGLPDTDRVGLDLADPAIELEVDVPSLRAVFCSPIREAVVVGECVRVLAVYARARSRALHTGDNGWLSIDEAHAAWCELGGRADSPAQRLGWERGKLRTQLARQGVRSLSRLFERRREGRATEVRLGVGRKNIHFVRDR